MRPSGVLYTANSSLSGEVRIALTEKEKKHFRLMRFIGANVSSLALAFVVFFYGPPFELNLDYQAGLASAQYRSPEESNVVNVALEKEENPSVEQYALFIPSIGASANVVRDVDAFDEAEYHEALKHGVAHAKGTGKPGEGKRIFLFAHSTSSPLNYSEYNAIFYQLRLLSEGERIFVDYNGESHLYIVKEKVVVSAGDTHWLTETEDREQLVLQTCDPPGTTLRRLLVVAEPEK